MKPFTLSELASQFLLRRSPFKRTRVLVVQKFKKWKALSNPWFAQTEPLSARLLPGQAAGLFKFVHGAFRRTKIHMRLKHGK